MQRAHTRAAMVVGAMVLACAAAAGQAGASDLTPPMGVDPYYSHLDTHGAVDEQGILATAGALASSGMRALGYREVALGNWWKNGERGPDGTIALDPQQWPHGVKPVTDALHAQGFSVRAYTDIGPFGCITPTANSYGHYRQDADTVAAWGLDALTVDWCGAYVNSWSAGQIQSAYTELAGELRHDGVTLDMALYDPRQESDNADWSSRIAETYRIGQDIGALGVIQFSRVLASIDKAAAHPETTGPGHFRDPDMIVAGVGPIGDDEGRLQMSMWAMLSAPLVLGTDVVHMSPATRATVTNPEIIAIDQDPLVKMASKADDDGAGHEIWVKPLRTGERAVALLNRTDRSASIATSARELGLPRAGAYRLRDVWQHATTETAGRIAATVPAHGVAVYRVAPGHAPVPDVSLAVDTPFAEAGRPATVAVDLENHGNVALDRVDAELDVPRGWRAVPIGPRPRSVRPSGRATMLWRVTPAGGAGSYTLGAGARFAGGRVATQATLTLASPPSGSAFLSDLPFLTTAASGWEPVSRVPERHGLVLPAPASAEVYLGGRCARFTGTVTLDDHDAFGTRHHGRVTLRVLRDGVPVLVRTLESDVLQTTPVDVDVRGARTLRIEADDTGGYWNYAYAFTQWDGAQVRCA